MLERLRRLRSASIGEWLTVAVTRAVAALGVLLLTFVTSRYAGTDALGHLIFALSVLIGLSHLARLGRDQACLRRTAAAWHWRRYDILRRLVRRTVFGVIATGIALSAAGTLGWSTLATLDPRLASPRTETLLLMGAVPLYALMLVWAAVLKAIGRAPLAAFFEVGGPCTIAAIVVAGVAAVGSEVDGPVVAGVLLAAIAALAVFGALFYRARLRTAHGAAGSAAAGTKTPGKGTPIRPPEAEVSDRLWDIAPALAVFTTASFVMQWTPSITLGAIQSAGDVGLYTVAFQASAVISFAVLVANTVLPRHIVRNHTSGNMAGLEQLVRRAAVGTVALAMVPSLGLLAVPEWVLAQFGTNDPAAVLALRVLASGQLFNVLCGSVMHVLNMTGHEKKVLHIVVATAGLHLILQFALIPCYGVAGAAAATAAALVFQNAAGVVAVRRALGVMPFPLWRRLRTAPPLANNATKAHQGWK